MAAATVKSDIFHPEHPLRRCSYGEGTTMIKTCAACEHIIVTGAIGYSCGECDFNIRETCLSLPVSISFDNHNQHKLTLTRLRASRWCDICTETSHAGAYMYRCKPCNYDVHPRCTPLLVAAQPPPQRIGTVQAIKIGFQIAFKLTDLLMTGGTMSPVVDAIVTALGTL